MADETDVVEKKSRKSERKGANNGLLIGIGVAAAAYFLLTRKGDAPADASSSTSSGGSADKAAAPANMSVPGGVGPSGPIPFGVGPSYSPPLSFPITFPQQGYYPPAYPQQPYPYVPPAGGYPYQPPYPYQQPPQVNWWNRTQYPVPSLIGMTEAQALSTLRRYGYSPCVAFRNGKPVGRSPSCNWTISIVRGRVVPDADGGISYAPYSDWRITQKTGSSTVNIPSIEPIF